MPETTQRPLPPVFRRDGFQFCDGHFSVLGVDRVDGSRLKELFNPPSLRLRRAQKAAEEEAHSLFKKLFFTAQLRYYGIPFGSSATRDEPELLLKDVVHQGKCERVPNGVIRLEHAMQSDYEPLYRKWRDEVTAWDAEKSRREDEAFNACKTPGEKANFDLNRFMEFYFLTDGRPDKGKTPEPLALYGFHDRRMLHEMAGSIPGLCAKSGGSELERILCVGWDPQAVSGLANAIESKAIEAQNKKRRAAKAEAVKAHTRYVAESKKGESSRGKRGATTTKKKGRPSRGFDLQRCIGSYVVECEDVSEGWSHLAHSQFTLDISGGRGETTLIAAYDFGVIEGTMLLSLSEEELDTMVDEESKSDDENDSESGSDGSDSEASDDENNDVDRTRPTKRKKSLAQAVAKPTDPSSKRRKTGPSLSRRVYYRLRGRETGEGEILPEPESGHLDFMSDDCARFAGLAYHFPYVKDNVDFSGYKVSDEPKQRAESWSAFSEEAYEYARRRRWG